MLAYFILSYLCRTLFFGLCRLLYWWHEHLPPIGEDANSIINYPPPPTDDVINNYNYLSSALESGLFERLSLARASAVKMKNSGEVYLLGWGSGN